MIEVYRAGITPNPDVMCNREIKFGLFLKKALAAGADYVATGHYVKIAKVGDHYGLFAARDKGKDQSYFLWTLTQNELQHCMFPIGDLLKSEVRAMARRGGLPTAEKRDSQGICFLGDISVDDFLKQYIPERRGALVTTEGKMIGEHSGAEFYTIGQRHINADFKFPKTGHAVARMPYYVSGKDAATNTVVVAEGSENPALYRKEIEIATVNIVGGLSGGVPDGAILARVRYRQPLAEAAILRLPNGNYRLIFARAQKFVAPGQSAVFYDADGEMLGGGVIV
jgi:tRNA-specific 2-thiouridylase